MANDAINPFQTIRDDAGVPVAGGSLNIRVNRTTDFGTAFSDSALQISQTVEGYQLDSYGRIRGDLRWLGERSVEIYRANGAFVRTDNDVVTLIDTSSFARNYASVAAMIADTTLEVGDVAETQSYNADQGEGGARYRIVANATGVDDAYLYHDLDNTFQAELIDRERNKNFYVAGAIGTGAADDTGPVNAVLAVGGNIECANGTFSAANLALAASARLHGDGVLLHSAFSTLDLLALSGADVTIIFDGVTIDGNSTNQIAENTSAGIRSTVTASVGAVSLISFDNVTFQNGTQYDVHGLGDDAASNVLYNFSQCNFLGGLESTATPFLAAYAAIGDGASALFEDCYFDLLAVPTATGGRGGVTSINTLGALTNPGYLGVNDNTFNGVGAVADVNNVLASIHAADVVHFIASDNRIFSPQYGGIVWRAEVDVLSVSGNMIDSLTGAELAGGIAALVTARAAPGNNWAVDGNELLSIGGVAININGASAGIDSSNLTINNNIIDSPTLQAMLIHNIDGLTIGENEVNMVSVAGINCIEINTDGVSGNVNIEGNELLNVDGTAILNGVTSTGAVFVVDGNPIENVVNGIDIQDAADAYITNNPIIDVSGVLITVGTLTNAVIDGNSYAGTVPATFANDAGGITNLVVGENFWTQLDTSITDRVIVGANQTAPVNAHYHVFSAAAPASIDTLSFAPDIDGYLLICAFEGANAITFNDGLDNLNLSASHVLNAVGETLTLAFDQSTGDWNQAAVNA